MDTFRRIGMLLLVAALGLSIAAHAGGVVEAASVTPVFVEGNATCQDVGYAYGFKVDPPTTGNKPIPNSGGKSVQFTLNPGGKSFNWTSSLAFDAVLSKGGPDSYLYVYNPPAKSFGDTNLVAPGNLGISHAIFCLTAAPTATYLDWFQGAARVKNVKLKWRTANEFLVVGFNVYRGDTKAGPYTQLNTGLIEAKHLGSMMGGKYVYKDATAQAGKKYFYRLELIQSDGSTLEESKILKLRKPPAQ
jgi:hypothetical protein